MFRIVRHPLHGLVPPGTARRYRPIHSPRRKTPLTLWSVKEVNRMSITNDHVLGRGEVIIKDTHRGLWFEDGVLTRAGLPFTSVARATRSSSSTSASVS